MAIEKLNTDNERRHTELIAVLQRNNPVQSVQNNFEHSDTGRNKLSHKLLTTVEWITLNDPNRVMSVRQIALSAGVSIGTAQAAIKIVQDEKAGSI